MKYKYRETVVNELARHGVMPLANTPPDFVHQFVNDLYLIEIRALRRRLKAGEIPKANYAKHVEALRRRYPILSLPSSLWVED